MRPKTIETFKKGLKTLLLAELMNFNLVQYRCCTFYILHWCFYDHTCSTL